LNLTSESFNEQCAKDVVENDCGESGVEHSGLSINKWIKAFE